jgi:hypothetical protein
VACSSHDKAETNLTKPGLTPHEAYHLTKYISPAAASSTRHLNYPDRNWFNYKQSLPLVMPPPAHLQAAAPSKRRYELLKTVLNVLNKITVIALAIAFGVWSIKSYRLSQEESCRDHPVSKPTSPLNSSIATLPLCCLILAHGNVTLTSDLQKRADYCILLFSFRLQRELNAEKKAFRVSAHKL